MLPTVADLDKARTKGAAEILRHPFDLPAASSPGEACAGVKDRTKSAGSAMAGKHPSLEMQRDWTSPKLPLSTCKACSGLRISRVHQPCRLLISNLTHLTSASQVNQNNVGCLQSRWLHGRRCILAIENEDCCKRNTHFLCRGGQICIEVFHVRLSKELKALADASFSANVLSKSGMSISSR